MVKTHQMFLYRGLPGTGKTFSATNGYTNGYIDYEVHIPSVPPNRILAADDFFDYEGSYVWMPEFVTAAHAYCMYRAIRLVKESRSFAVTNTFVYLDHIKPYLDLAESHFYAVTIVELDHTRFTNDELFARNQHNVPLQTIERMRYSWEEIPEEWKTKYNYIKI